MRGIGVRRRDTTDMEPVPPIPARRSSPVKRKPVPSTVFESPPRPEPIKIPKAALSSTAKEIARLPNPPTPEADDTPYVHFALDQITRDEGKTYVGPEFEEKYEQDPIFIEKGVPIPPEPFDEPIPIPPRSPRRSYTPAPPPMSPGKLSFQCSKPKL